MTQRIEHFRPYCVKYQTFKAIEQMQISISVLTDNKNTQLI